jgi:hypothetical protein
VLLPRSSAGPRAQRRARREGAGAHAEARAERRGNVAEEIAAAGAVAVAAEWSGGIGAEPVAASFALRIDTLHGETGHVLHFFSPQRPQARSAEPPWCRSN